MEKIKYSLLLLIIVFIGCGPSEQTNNNDNVELIGHRGATGLMPENTIPAFKEALKYSADSIELDVVISGDDQVVVSHEPYFRHDICLTAEGDSISEENQMDHLIYEMNYEQIAQYDCGSLQRPGYPEQQNQPLSKPLLKDAIEQVDAYAEQNDMGPIHYNVEIKSNAKWDGRLQPYPDRAMELTYNVLADLDVLDRVRIFAFDNRVLNALEEIDSSIPQVYLISGRKTNMDDNLDLLTHKPDIYAPNYSIVDSVLIERAHEEGMQVMTWTVNDLEEMKQLINAGVDGIISDYPNYFDSLEVGSN